MRLDLYRNPDFDRGAPRWKEAAWLVVSGLLVATWLPGSGWRRSLLRLFGARIGQGVVFKPGVTVKFPWKLAIGDHSWIGEHVWIDNLAEVRIGSHACLSQEVYVCTGSHDWSLDSFDLITRPVVVGDEAWICARSSLAPGTIVEEGAVVGLGSVARGTLSRWSVHGGNPAVLRGPRRRAGLDRLTGT